MKATLVIASITLSLVLATGCKQSNPEPTPSVSDKPRVTAHDAPAPETGITEETSSAALLHSVPSEGMRLPVDGSTVESFDQSLAAIKAQATADEYANLSNAIGYLLVYTARNDRAKLAKSLDGLTGEQIIAQANSNKGAK